MNDNTNMMISCPRCKSPMNINARYCIKCGALNQEHEANKNLIKNINQNDTVSNGKWIQTNQNTDEVQIRVASNTGSTSLCFIINTFIYISSVILVFLSVVNNIGWDLDALSISYFPAFAIIISIIFLYLYSLQLLFIKCNQKWWSGLIPFYNLVILSEITFNKKNIIILLIPGINIIYFFIMIYKLGKQFRYNPWLVMLLSPLYLPIMAYGDHLYENKSYINEEKERTLEEQYRLKKTYLAVVFIIIILGIILIIKGKNNDVLKTKNLLGNTYYAYASKKLVKKISNKIDNSTVICNDINFSKDNGVYYFYYQDISEIIYLPFYYLREPIEGYVKVAYGNNNTKYYVSLTDGEYGILETEINDIKYDTIIEFSQLNYSQQANSCRFE